MARTIYKFTLNLVTEQVIAIPRWAKLLHIAPQGPTTICAWFEVDTKQPVDFLWRVFVVGTGHEIPDTATAHMATLVVGAYVWHFYTDSFQVMK